MKITIREGYRSTDESFQKTKFHKNFINFSAKPSRGESSGLLPRISDESGRRSRDDVKSRMHAFDIFD